MKALHLIRHGETPWNAEKRLQGQHDVPLSPHGRLQASSLRPTVENLLADHRSDGPVTVVSSPLLRARETCDLLNLTPAEVDARWQEADLGEWTGRTRDELVGLGDGEYAAWRAGRFSPPGAEPMADLHHRVAEAIEALANCEVVVVITHGGPIRSACRQLVGLQPHHLVPVLPGSLTSIDLSGKQPRLRVYNFAPAHTNDLTVEPPD